MKKILIGMSIVVLAAVVYPLRSDAFGGEALGCFVNEGTPGTFHAGSCITSKAKSSYTVQYKVLNESGTYTFAWNTNGFTVASGCTSTSDSCNVTVRGIPNDQDVTVSVTITQSGQSATLSATAFIPAVCGNVLC